MGEKKPGAEWLILMSHAWLHRTRISSAEQNAKESTAADSNVFSRGFLSKAQSGRGTRNAKKNSQRNSRVRQKWPL